MSNAVLSEDQKTLLKKGPSFIPIPTDINWYDVRKDFNKFINKIRHFADVSDQPVQQQKEQQQLEVNPENIYIYIYIYIQSAFTKYLCREGTSELIFNIF